MTVSLNFWFNPENDTIEAKLHKKVPVKHGQNKKNETTHSENKKSFTPAEELVLKREIESMIYETTRDHHKVGMDGESARGKANKYNGPCSTEASERYFKQGVLTVFKAGISGLPRIRCMLYICQ